MSIFNNISSILFIILMLVFNLSFYKFFFFFSLVGSRKDTWLWQIVELINLLFNKNCDKVKKQYLNVAFPDFNSLVICASVGKMFTRPLICVWISCSLPTEAGVGGRWGEWKGEGITQNFLSCLSPPLITPWTL